MSVTPDQIWAHAQNLPQTSEEELRAKISRSYYALYSHACMFNDQLESEGNVFKRASGSHSQLSQKLTNPTVKDPVLQVSSRDLGTKQKLAHELRVKADYELDVPVNQKDLMQCLGYVRRGMAIPVPKKAAA